MWVWKTQVHWFGVWSFSHYSTPSLQSSPPGKWGPSLWLRSSSTKPLPCPGSHCFSPLHSINRICLDRTNWGFWGKRSFTRWYSPKSFPQSSVIVPLHTASLGQCFKRYLPAWAQFRSFLLVFMCTSVSGGPWLFSRCQAFRLEE